MYILIIRMHASTVLPLACVTVFLMDEALLSISTSPAGCGQSVEMLIALEPHGIFGINLAYLSIYTLFSICNAKSFLIFTD